MYFSAPILCLLLAPMLALALPSDPVYIPLHARRDVLEQHERALAAASSWSSRLKRLVSRADPISPRSPPPHFDVVVSKPSGGGGGGGGGRGGGGSVSSSGSSSSGSSSSAGRSGSSSSSSGSSGSSTRGSTTSAPPSYGGGTYYAGGARSSYAAGGLLPTGGRSPSYYRPAFVGGFFPGIWLFGVYGYPYGHHYPYHNRTDNRNESLPVECFCQQYQPCGCDDTGNNTAIGEMLSNSSIANIANVNGTETVVINGSLPNGTDDSSSSSISSRLAVSGWSPVLVMSGHAVLCTIVATMVFS